MMMKEMYEYQVDFDVLLRKMPKLDGQIDLIRQLRQRGQMLHREYNDSVDTNVSLYRRLDFDRGIIRDQDASKEVVLTTNHYVKLLTL